MTAGRHVFVPPRDSAAEPVCLLTREWAARRREPVEELLDAAVRVEALENGIEYEFASAPGLWRRLETFVDEEGECCPFLAFELMEREDDVVLRAVHLQV